MKIKIEFDTDNAAFDDEALTDECYNVFQACLDRIDKVIPLPHASYAICDSNGNGIGEIEIKMDSAEFSGRYLRPTDAREA
tara:strand:- start:550 stop:792 length:243 start_codon:yes stop_codon:yes gene_type:complete